jgi:RsiW-degrading membrane proteinase PrsW (M82 family)
MDRHTKPDPTNAQRLSSKAILLMLALATVLVAMTVVIWGLPALVMIALICVPVMFVWFFIISRP